jgi:hypothetical protein
MNAFEELVRVQALDEEMVRREFSVGKNGVLRVLKTCAVRELQMEKMAEEEIQTAPPKEPRKARTKKAESTEEKPAEY